MSSGTIRDMPGAASNQQQAGHSAFVPLLLALIALITILAWTLFVAARQTSNLQSVKFQVWQATAQSVQSEQKIKAMLSDLVELAVQDPKAAAIVKRYKIKQNAAVPSETVVSKGEARVTPRATAPEQTQDEARTGKQTK